MEERSIVFVGVRPEAKGGIASVLQLYKEHFSQSRFFASYVHTGAWFNMLVFPFVSLRFIWLLATKPGIRLVHLHGASNGSFYRKYVLFLIAKYAFRRKVVYHVHGGGFHRFYATAPEWVRARVRHFIRKADALICLSDSWKRFFLEHFHLKRIEVIHNAIERVMPGERKAQEGKVTFLFMGKIMEPKGIYDLLHTAARLQKKYAGQFEVWVAGDGAAHTLRAQIENSGLQDAVWYKGWVTGEAKEALLRDAQVFVLPSHNEGMPVSILEAMAWRMPVISTTVGGIPELIQEGDSGLLIEPGDRPALYRAMECFIQSPSLIHTMGNTAAEYVAEHFVFDITRQKLTTLYAALDK